MKHMMSAADSARLTEQQMQQIDDGELCPYCWTSPRQVYSTSYGEIRRNTDGSPMLRCACGSTGPGAAAKARAK